MGCFYCIRCAVDRDNCCFVARDSHKAGRRVRGTSLVQKIQLWELHLDEIVLHPGRYHCVVDHQLRCFAILGPSCGDGELSSLGLSNVNGGLARGERDFGICSDGTCFTNKLALNFCRVDRDGKGRGLGRDLKGDGSGQRGRRLRQQVRDVELPVAVRIRDSCHFVEACSECWTRYIGW